MKVCMITAVLPLLAGFILDFIMGDPYWLWHPIRVIGRLIAKLEEMVRKKFSKHLQAGGLLLVIAVLTISAGSAAILLFLCYQINVWFGIAAESIICYYMLAARCLKKESMKVWAALKEKDTKKARQAVSMIVGRDTAVLDETGIIKAAVETVAENTSDGVTAPIFYLMLGGGVFGVFYKAANTMDSMIGYTEEKYLQIGHYAAKLDDVLNWLPSRLTAVFMIGAAALLGYDAKGAYRIWKRDRRKHASPNSAQTEAVCAGALGVELAGDAWYFGVLHKKQKIGDPLRKIETDDIKRANRLMYLTSVMMLLTAAAVKALTVFLLCIGI